MWRSLWRDMDDADTIAVQEVFKFDTPTPIFTCELRESSIDLSASLSGRKLGLVIFARLWIGWFPGLVVSGDWYGRGRLLFVVMPHGSWKPGGVACRDAACCLKARWGCNQDLRENFLAVPLLSEELEPEISVFKFIPVVGRVVESLHRDVKVAAKHFHCHHISDVWPPSAVYVFFMCFWLHPSAAETRDHFVWLKSLSRCLSFATRLSSCHVDAGGAWSAVSFLSLSDYRPVISCGHLQFQRLLFCQADLPSGCVCPDYARNGSEPSRSASFSCHAGFTAPLYLEVVTLSRYQLHTGANFLMAKFFLIGWKMSVGLHFCFCKMCFGFGFYFFTLFPRQAVLLFCILLWMLSRAAMFVFSAERHACIIYLRVMFEARHFAVSPSATWGSKVQRRKRNSPAGNAMAQQLADVLHPLPVAALGVLLRSRSGETDRQQLGDRGGWFDSSFRHWREVPSMMNVTRWC